MRKSRPSRGMWSHVLATVCVRLDGDELLQLIHVLLPICRFVDKRGIAGNLGVLLVIGMFQVCFHWLSRYLWEWLPLAMMVIIGVVFYVVPSVYRSSLEALAYRTDSRAVGPLMDAVAFKLRRPLDAKVEPDARWIEGLILRRLPAFLDRMSAGDGPTLTPTQSDALRWLVDRSEYYAYFLQPGLNEKVDGMIASSRT